MATIVTTPNPVLREVSRPIGKLDKKALRIIKNVQDTLKNGKSPKGVGLSAVQIGKPIRIFATFLPKSGNPDDETKPVLSTYVNPEILDSSRKKTLGGNKKKPILEGCLSIPGIWGPVSRHEWVELKWQMENGEWQLEKFTAFPARVIQHELDHLNGILFTDHSLRDKLPLYESQGDELVKISM